MTFLSPVLRWHSVGFMVVFCGVLWFHDGFSLLKIEKKKKKLLKTYIA